MAELPKGLLSDIESYLNITWQDTATDAKITGYINRGMARLQQIAGVSSPVNFTEEDLPRSLLFDYCRYANSQALEVFEQNFQSELLELNLKNQAPIIDLLTLITLTDVLHEKVFLTASPALLEGHRYVCEVGSNLALPVRMKTCELSTFSLWDGISGISAVHGQDILIVEVNDEFNASRAGKFTVS